MILGTVSHSPDLAESALRSQSAWTWLVSSGCDEISNEDRRGWCAEHFSDVLLLTLQRAAPGIPHRFRLMHGQATVEAEWNGLGAAISGFIPPGAAILLDTSHLSFDALLYLLPALRTCRPAALTCVYVAPEHFQPVQNDALEVQDTLPIGQPKGYVALTTDENRTHSRHIVLLGFDKGRAWKFIQRYDWDEAHLHLLVGDPPFVANGAEIALEACQPWLEPFRKRYPDQIHHLDAREPEQVRAFLRQQLDASQWLDIVPLGPKPMLLGVLAFYFELSDVERSRVRLLYDFSQQRLPRCDGVSRIYAWDCTMPVIA